ncbi:MAG: ParB/RepB/Spo0J family partition protein [Candidatus Omnitrophota bacterium]|jgi:ParB family chromosome partitioning protein|nr:ParB/RepB/Spo0J family partition protein [Candidatus Omnitrophota bacterium]
MSKALGKGLAALIPEKATASKEDGVNFLQVELIKDSRLQPRTNYDGNKLDELKASIKEKGVLQPILVRRTDTGYEIIAGERRLKAARALGLTQVPAIVKDVTDREALVIALIENIQRQELNPMEEAEAYKKLIEEFHYTHDEVAQSVAKDRSTITNMLRLLNLPEEIKKSLYGDVVSVGHARALLSADSTSEMKRIYQLIVKKQLSVRETERLVNAGKPESRRQKRSMAQHPQIATLQEGLQKLLGTKVTIAGGVKRGKIMIEYYSLEDLDRIVRTISHK